LSQDPSSPTLANFILMFKQDDLNTRHIYLDHINTDMNYETFVKICEKCWEDKHGLLLISKDNEMDTGRYRNGFDQFIMIFGQRASGMARRAPS